MIHHSPFNLLAAGLFTTLLLSASNASADIYRYLNANGEIILTTEPRKDLKLIEIIRSEPQKKTTSKKTVKTADNNSPPAQSSATTDRSHQYDAFINEAAEQYNIPAAFIRAVIKIESNFNPTAVSSAGAMGLMQLMPATAEHMKVSDPFDPRQNILGGTRYLRRLSDRYDGDINLVLSGYHAGPGNVERAGGIPFRKTQQYVKNVYHWYLKYKNEIRTANATK